MNPLQAAEQAAETALPALRGARWVLIGAAVLIALVGAGAAFWALFLRPIEDRTRVEQGKVDTRLSGAAADIATKAIPVITETERRRVEIDVAVQRGTIDVHQAADAATPIAGVSDAVRRGNCMLPALYHADGACAAVRADRQGVGPAGRDAGGAAGPD